MYTDEKQKKIKQAERVDFAIRQLMDLGYEFELESPYLITFMHDGHKVRLFPYTGWFTGKSVNDGRGILNLVNQLTND